MPFDGPDGFDLVCLSVIFSWQALLARELAIRFKLESEVFPKRDWLRPIGVTIWR